MSTIIERDVDAEEVAESYVMGRMPLDNAALFLVHLGRCTECAARVEQAAAFLAAMRGAARILREYVPPLDKSTTYADVAKRKRRYQRK